MEYEIDKEKFSGKGNLGIPEMVRDSKRFSKSTGLVTDPILSMKKTIKIAPGKQVVLDLIMGVSEHKEVAEKSVIKYENNNVITNTIELARAKTEAENIYLRLKGADVEKYQAILTYMLFQNPMKSIERVNLASSRIRRRAKTILSI